MNGLKVLGREDKNRIIIQAQAAEAAVYFKFLNSKVFRTATVQSGSLRTMVCWRPPGLAIANSHTPVTVNFIVNSEIYFFTTIVSIKQKEISFAVDGEIFHLSRRLNRRLRLPKDYEAIWMIKRLSGQMSFLRGVILDLSTTGCRLALNTDMPRVKIKDVIEGSLKLGRRQPLEIRGEVRFHKIPKTGDYKQVFGIKFFDMNKSVEAKIQHVNTELQREFLLRSLE